MYVPSPKLIDDDQYYYSELKEALDGPITTLIDRVCSAGWSKYEVFIALTEVIREHALAHDESHAEANYRTGSELDGRT